MSTPELKDGAVPVDVGVVAETCAAAAVADTDDSICGQVLKEVLGTLGPIDAPAVEVERKEPGTIFDEVRGDAGVARDLDWHDRE